MNSVLPIEIKVRIVRAGLRQEQVAAEMGCDPTLFSRILNGRRPPPPDFEFRANAVLDRMEAKKRALEKGAA